MSTAAEAEAAAARAAAGEQVTGEPADRGNCTKVVVDDEDDDSFSGPVGDGGDLIDVLLHGT